MTKLIKRISSLSLEAMDEKLDFVHEIIAELGAKAPEELVEFCYQLTADVETRRAYLAENVWEG
jgi:hypothetical protein